MTVRVRLVYGLMLCLVSGFQVASVQEAESIRWLTTFERATSEGPGMYVIVGDQKEIVARFSLEVVRGAGVVGVDDAAGEIAVIVEENGRVLPTSI
jgi:hypothetical protein